MEIMIGDLLELERLRDGRGISTTRQDIVFENAIKYSSPDSRPVEVSATQNGEKVVIRVTDDGPGIPDRDMPNLFEPFFRVDRSRSREDGWLRTRPQHLQTHRGGTRDCRRE
jgi:signal transduction histidine kinase